MLQKFGYVGDIVKIIKIGAIWCPGCLVMKKIWKKIMTDDNNLDVIELDYDMDSELVSKYNPGKFLPVVIFISKEGNEIERLVGEQSEDTLRRKIKEYEDI